MTTFAEFAATADARERIAQNVLLWTQMLCEALEQDFIEESIKRHRFFSMTDNAAHHEQQIEKIKNREDTYQFIIETGRKYHKIVMVVPNGDRPASRSVHAFIDKKTGELYKSASFKAPAKGVRYDLRIIEQREQVLRECDWSGGYLYQR